MTPLVRADRLAERLGLRRGLDQERRRQPDPLVQGPGRRGRAREGARARASRRVACASTGNLANAVAAHAAAAGLESYVFVPADLEEQKLLATGVYGTEAGRRPRATTTTSTGSARSSARPGPGRSSTSTCAPTTPRARRRSPTRSSSSSAGRLPDRIVCPIASGSLFTKIGRGFPEWRELGLVAGELPTFHGAQAERLQPGRRGLRRGLGGLQAAAPATRSPRASRSATPPTAPTRSTSPGAPAARSTAVSDDEIRAGIRLLAETTGIFTETAGGVTTAVLAKLAESGAIGPSERVVAVITGEGLKTLDAVRDGFDDRRDRPLARLLRVERAGRARSRGGLTLALAPMAVTVKIPAQLRAVTGGASEVEVDGETVGEALDAVFDRARRPARADHRGRRPAPVRQRLRLGRGHPLPGRPRDPARRRRRGDDPPGRRRWRALAPAADLPVVILCGGRGTRLQEQNARDPEGAGRDRRPSRSSGT